MFGSKGGLPTSRGRARTSGSIETFHDINLATVVKNTVKDVENNKLASCPES